MCDDVFSINIRNSFEIIIRDDYTANFSLKVFYKLFFIAESSKKRHSYWFFCDMWIQHIPSVFLRENVNPDFFIFILLYFTYIFYNNITFIVNTLLFKNKSNPIIFFMSS